MSVDVYSCETFSEFLKKLGLWKRNHPTANLIHLAERLGYRSPRSVSMVYSGKRLPSQSMIHKIAEMISLDSRQTHYLELIVRRQRLQIHGQEDHALQARIQTFQSQDVGFHHVPTAEFSMLSDWFLMPLLQLLNQPNCPKDVTRMANKFRFPVTVNQLQCALKTLVSQGLVEKDDSGRYKVLKPAIETGGAGDNERIARYHRQMILRSLEAIELQHTDERGNLGLTFTMNQEFLPQAKQELRNFVKEFCKKYHQPASQSVMQLNLQLFQHLL